MKRVAVVGNTGTGKSTLAKAIAARLDLRYIELDALHWEAGWTPAPPERFRARVTAALEDGWVSDGNYAAVQDLVWAKADTVIWLDYPLGLVLLRLLRRTVTRIATRERLWNDNVETFGSQFLSRNSIFLWAVRTHHAKRRRYLAQMAGGDARHAQRWIRLRSPRETRAFLERL